MNTKMMKRLSGIALSLVLTAAGAQPALALIVPDSVVDIRFDDGTVDNFMVYTNGGKCDISNADGALAVDITSCGKLDYANQVYWDGLSLDEGVAYTYSFDAASTIDRQIEYRIQLNGGDYHAYVGDWIEVGPEMQHYSVDFTMNEPTDPAPRIAFNMGLAADMTEDPGEHRITFDNISLVITDDSGAVASDAGEETYAAVSQIGYRPSSKKTVTVRDISEAGTFSIIEASTGENVFDGELPAPSHDAATDSLVSKGDFSEFKEEGQYYVHVECGDVSEDTAEFVIADGVYDDVYRAAVKMLDLQRCGAELTEEIGGDYAHPACHTEEAVIYGTDETRDVSGGWHDAGDYGRYVVAGAKAAADLLLAYEDYALDEDDLGIPESGNGVPDVLDEVRYELEWMLKMQDPESGGVYHKVTCMVFPGTVMPQEETDTLYLAPISTAATGDFAAVMAKASVIYRSLDEEFADAMLNAARSAWAYIKDLEDTEGFHNPSDIVTGEYPDSDTGDEHFWAAAELLLAGEADLEEDVDKWFRGAASGFGWADMSGYALYDLAKAGPSLKDTGLPAEEFSVKAQEHVLAAADDVKRLSEEDGYGMALGTEYPWGSNMTVANNGMLSLMAARLTGDASYVGTAETQLAYLLGENATGYCFVSGFGSTSISHPHHRPSQAVGAAMPGMLAGGPDSSLEDPYAQGALAGNAPALCYADSDQSYSTNEVTIYWNSPLVYLLAGCMK